MSVDAKVLIGTFVALGVVAVVVETSARLLARWWCRWLDRNRP